MSDQQVEKPKRASVWRRFKSFFVKIYIIIVTAALIHFALSTNSETYRDVVGELEQSIQDLEIELPEIEVDPTPKPVVFDSDEYGGDAFLPAFILEPGRYRYVITGEPWMGRMVFCGVPGLFSAARDRFDLEDSCEIRLTVSGLGDTPWSITIEPDLEYQATGW